MSELLAWDGPWSTDLINLMLPVAVEIETKREQAFGRAVIAAVSTFGKSSVWEEYARGLEKVHEKVRQDQMTQRGLTKEDFEDLAMRKFIADLKKLKGLRRQ